MTVKDQIWDLTQNRVWGFIKKKYWLVIIAVIVCVLLGWAVYLHFVLDRGWADWTGIGEYQAVITNTSNITADPPDTTVYYRGKTLWDLLELLLVPAVLVAMAWSLNRAGQARKIAEHRADTVISAADALISSTTCRIHRPGPLLPFRPRCVSDTRANVRSGAFAPCATSLRQGQPASAAAPETRNVLRAMLIRHSPSHIAPPAAAVAREGPQARPHPARPDASAMLSTVTLIWLCR